MLDVMVSRSRFVLFVAVCGLLCVACVARAAVVTVLADDARGRLLAVSDALGKAGDNPRLHSLVEIGATGVLVVDPGGTPAQARARWAAVLSPGPTASASMAGPTPALRLVVDTATAPERVLGNRALLRAAIAGEARVAASAATREGMAQRCTACRRALAHTLGRPALTRVPIRLPDLVLADGEALPAGFGHWQAFVFAQARTRGDLALWDGARGVLYAGALVSGDAVPDLAQASLAGWIAALERLRALAPRIVVGAAPGDVFTPATLDATLAYLRALRDAVRADLDAGGDAASADRRLRWPMARPADPGAARRHARNVQHAWREIEDAALLQNDAE